MRRTSRAGLSGGVVLAALILSRCVPSDADVVGSWNGPDGMELVFDEDLTFSAQGFQPHVLLIMGITRDDVPAELVGTWYVESPFEDVCESGETIKVSWRTEPVLYSDAFCLIGRGAEAVLTVPTYLDEGATEYLDLRRE